MNDEVRCPYCTQVVARLLVGQAEFKCNGCKRVFTLKRSLDTKWKSVVVS